MFSFVSLASIKSEKIYFNFKMPRYEKFYADNCMLRKEIFIEHWTNDFDIFRKIYSQKKSSLIKVQ